MSAGVRHFGNIGETGVALGYRKGTGKASIASWSVRYEVGNNRYKLHRLGDADDIQDADGERVLNYKQAVAAARAFVASRRKVTDENYTVRDAYEDYLEWYPVHGNKGKGGKNDSGIRSVAKAHILPHLGDYKLADLTSIMIRNWVDGIVQAPPKGRSQQPKMSATSLRARKATANRILTVLKAMLNVAYQNQKILSDAGWRSVKPFQNVDAPRISWFTPEELQRLINACEPDFRKLVLAALYSGCRYGELANALVHWFDRENGLLHIPAQSAKNGEDRDCYLNEDGVKFFSDAAVGKGMSDHLFTRSDGSPWKRAQQQRPMQRACLAANIDPPKSFHILRHSYATALISAGVSIEIVAACIGDKDLRTAKRHYAHLANDQIKATIRQHLPSFTAADENRNVLAFRAKNSRADREDFPVQQGQAN